MSESEVKCERSSEFAHRHRHQPSESESEGEGKGTGEGEGFGGVGEWTKISAPAIILCSSSGVKPMCATILPAVGPPHHPNHLMH